MPSDCRHGGIKKTLNKMSKMIPTMILEKNMDPDTEVITTALQYSGKAELKWPGHVAQSVGHLTRKSEVLGSIPGLATYFRFSFR